MLGGSQNLFLRNLGKASDSYGLFIFPHSSIRSALQSHKSNFVYFAKKLPIFWILLEDRTLKFGTL